MSVDEYLKDPWSTHPTYKNSAFSINPAPEFSTAEVAIASLYRAAGFSNAPENAVGKNGRVLNQKAIDALRVDPEPNQIRAGTWRTVLTAVLESPKQPKQTAKRLLQLCPLVPDISLYSGSARATGNSWNPGALIQRMILLGAPRLEDARELWHRLFIAISVSDDDDIWARWVQKEFESRRLADTSWAEQELEFQDKPLLRDEEKAGLHYPAKQFVKDLYAVIEAKGSMTRRQWVSVLDSIVRLGMVMHVLWLCHINQKLWRQAFVTIRDDAVYQPPLLDSIRKNILDSNNKYLSHGNAALPIIKDYASGYLTARLGLNLAFWELEERGVKISHFGSAEDISTFLAELRVHRSSILGGNFMGTLSELRQTEAKTISCAKGIGSNLIEFSRHTLGQRQTSNESLRGYDQSYFLKKRGAALNAPWVLALGPVALLTLVHCCLKGVDGPRSVRRLSDHLATYGLEVDVDGINTSDLGKSLRMLGLVLDSPDAESGMLLVPPFAR